MSGPLDIGFSYTLEDLVVPPSIPTLAAVLNQLVALPPLRSTFYIFGSLESLYCINTLAFVALNSSSRDEEERKLQFVAVAVECGAA